MIAFLSKLIDWSAIQVRAIMKPPAIGQGVRLAEALKFLKGPDFIPAQSLPARLEFKADKSELHFRFPSPRPGEFAENDFAYGRFYICGQDWRKRPVILLLPGANEYLSHRFAFPLIARRCYRAGFNAATWVAPYFGQRRPRQRGVFKRRDYLLEAEATAQAIAEIRALTGWLLAEGCPTVALWGTSFGGWLAGMAACHDVRLAAVVLNTPAVRPNLLYAEHLLWPGIREVLKGNRVAVEALKPTALNLTSIQPVIPKDNILLIEAVHDLMVPRELIEDLWQAWGRPDIWRLPHGHMSISLKVAPSVTDRVLRWLAPRLSSADDLLIRKK